MADYKEIPGTNVIEFTMDGSIGAEEFDALLEMMTAAIEEHGKVRVLEHIKSMGTIPPSRLWEDIKFGFQHLKDISHVAVVADQKWIEMLAKVISPLYKAEIKFFRRDSLDEAREWITTAEDKPAD